MTDFVPRVFRSDAGTVAVEMEPAVINGKQLPDGPRFQVVHYGPDGQRWIPDYRTVSLADIRFWAKHGGPIVFRELGVITDE